MILIDSSVWIDFFCGHINRETDLLARWLAEAKADLGVADLVLFKVMRGFRTPKDQAFAKRLLLTLEIVEIGGTNNALLAAAHYSHLRARGFTMRSSMDVLLASYCIERGHVLLHRDADFDALQTLRGLKTWRH